ncbi:hypothetical protein CK203_105554 [Vitis vinifera]|uniref:DUF4283 domain-containing protein n=1 Tax=Vitis vinifera TaxID=29760 RepID=A0A438BXP4_VITVI|nr:hypothetical protein CK203_105554 [Vitis vinifera]
MGGKPLEGDSRVQDVSDQAVRASKEKDKESQVSKGMYREGRSYADVVAEKGHRNGASMPVGRWARAVICESKGKILDWFDVGKVIARMMGTKGMVSVTPISEYKGCFFVDSARRAMWFQDQGSLTVRGGVVALRRWSPKENSVVGGKFRREMGEGNEGGKGNSETRRLVEGKDVGGDASKSRATSFARGGRRSLVFTVAVSVIGEAEEDFLLRPESNRSKDEVTSAEGCVHQRPKNAEGLRATARDNEYHRWRPRHRSRVRAHFEEKNIGPSVGPVHETEAGSSNGGPATPSSSKLQRSGTSAKEVMPIAQSATKLKGNSVTARRKARSWPPSLKVTSIVPKRNLDGDGAPEANRGFIWGRSVFKKGALSPVSEKSRRFTGGTEGDEGISTCNWVKKVRPPSLALSEKDLPLVGLLIQIFFPTPLFLRLFLLDVRLFLSIPLESSLVSQRSPFPKIAVVEPSRLVGVSRSEGVAFPLETSNRNSEDWPLFKDSLSSPEKLCVSGKAQSPNPEPPASRWKAFRLRDSRLEKWSRFSRFWRV